VPREDHTLQFCVVEGSGGWDVELWIDGAVVGTTRLDLEWRADGGDSATALRLLQKGGGSDQDLRLVGSLLWSSLLGEGAVRDGAQALWGRLGSEPALHVAVRLRVPPDLDDLPWEAAYDETAGRFVGGHRRSSIIRDPWRDVGLAPVRTRSAQLVRMLVVVPTGSGLDVNTELRRMREALAPVMGAITGALHGAGPRELHERATASELRRVLAEGRWDIVHFIGHGRVNDRDGTSLRLVDENGEDAWQTQSAVSNLFDDTGVQLVVLNACAAGKSSTKGGFAGLGPVLLANGIPAVVAMRYDIEDRAAIELSAAFYRELFTGRAPGRVEPALQEARGALLRSFGARDPRVFVTPALFLAPGQAPLFELAQVTSAPAPVLDLPASRPPMALPAALIAAVKKGLCVPVIGPHLDGPKQRSAAAAAPSLVRTLAKACGYPHDGEIALAERAADGADLWVLQRVCQHFEVTQDRNSLTDAVLAASQARAEPPAALRSLARWRVPGVVSTSYDVAVHRAFQAEQPAHRALHRIDEPTSPGDGTTPLLVHLRGSVGDDTSLVLTEADHEALLERIAGVEGEVASLVSAGRGRTLLFLGVSPRDACVRALARRLLPETIRRFCAVVFVGACGDVDRALWDSLRVKMHWIDAEPAAVIAELSRLAREATS